MTAVAEGIESAGELEFLEPMAAPSDRASAVEAGAGRGDPGLVAHPSRLMAPVTG